MPGPGEACLALRARTLPLAPTAQLIEEEAGSEPDAHAQQDQHEQ